MSALSGLRTAIAVCLASALFLGLSLPAWAQGEPTPALDVQRFVPSGTYRNFVLVHDGNLLPTKKFGVDGVLQFGFRPLQQVSTDLKRSDGAVDGVLALHGRAGFAITDWVQIDLGMALMQFAVTGTAIEELGGEQQVFSLGDIWLEGRFKPLREEEHFISLVAIPFLTFPTGNPTLFLTSGVPTLGVKVAVSKTWTRFHVAGHLGYRLLPGSAVVAENVAAEDQILFGIGFGGSILPGRLDVNAEWVGAGIVGPGVDELPRNDGKIAMHSPMELLFDARIRIRNNLDLIVGAGPGLSSGVGTPAFRIFGGLSWAPSLDADGDTVGDALDACPKKLEDFDGFEDADGCPDADNDEDGILDLDDSCPDEAEDFDGFKDRDGCPEADNDHDLFLDADDLCPEAAEDRDGFEDDDGCPETDNDLDGVADTWDACPLTLEDHDGFEDNDGCPDGDNDGDGVLDDEDLCPMRQEIYDGKSDADGCPDDVLAVLYGDHIVLIEPIEFASGSNLIFRRSFPVLDALRDLLVEDPSILRLGIEGPQDAGNAELAGAILSEGRGRAIMLYLLNGGVASERMSLDATGEAGIQAVLTVHERRKSEQAARLEILIEAQRQEAQERAQLAEERAEELERRTQAEGAEGEGEAASETTAKPESVQAPPKPQPVE